MGTLNDKNKLLEDSIKSTSGEVFLLKTYIERGDLSQALDKAGYIYKNIIEIEKQSEEIKSITYSYINSRAASLNDDKKLEFRNKNHNFGGKIHSSLQIIAYLKEAIEANIEKGDVIKAVDALKDDIDEMKNQAVEVQKTAFSFVDVNKELLTIEAEQKDKNKGIKVLVVDDDTTVLHFTEQRLKNRKFDVFTGTEVAEAIKILKEIKPDIIILDLALPSYLEGLDVLRFIKDHHLATKCIVATKIDDEELEIVKKLNPEKILIKPFSVDELLAQINVLTRTLN